MIIIIVFIILFILISAVTLYESIVLPITVGGVEESNVQLSRDDFIDLMRIKEDFDRKTLEPIYQMDQIDQLPYRQVSKLIDANCHVGQRKLLLTEIQFYTNIKDNLVIYAGSAPGDHMSVILKMFPEMRFILIDPAFHGINHDYVIVYQNLEIVSPDNVKTFIHNARSKDTRVQDHAKRLLAARFYSPKLTDMAQYDTLHAAEDFINKVSTPTTKAIIEHKSEFEKTLYETLIEDITNGNERIFIIQDYLTPELADLLSKAFNSKRVDFSFVSDLRSNAFGDVPSDMDYVWNDALQLYTVMLLEPSHSMLKFHPPYFDKLDSYKTLMDPAERAKNGFWQKIYDDLILIKSKYRLDMLANYANKQHIYLGNVNIYLQAWAPNHSSETRLIVSKASAGKFVDYPHDTWDQKGYYLRKLRMYGYFGKFYELIKHMHGHRYDGGFDSMLEMFILGHYCHVQTMSEHDNTWSMSADAVAATIKRDPKALLALTKLIDDNLLYGYSVKCGFLGQLTQPLIGINAFCSVNKKLYKIRLNAIDSANVTNSVKLIEPTRFNLAIADNTKAADSAVATVKRLIERGFE